MNKYLISLALIVFISACEKQEIVVDVSTQDSVLKIIEAEKNIQSLNSVSFAVVKGDELVWADAIGKATDNLLATIDTRFLIASISKSVTAIAAMKLAEENALDLDTDINTYLTFAVRNPNFPNKPITTRMLLNHSSSISDAHYGTFDFYCWNQDCAVPLDVFLKDFFDSNGKFYSTRTFYNDPPGEKGNYSNMGYALLGYVVEKVANQPFDEYCKENIFIPLGMQSTEWRLNNTPLNELATPYSPTITPSAPHYTFPDYPNGGIRSTPSDMSKFVRMLINNGTFNGNQVVTANTIDEIKFRPFPITRGGLRFDLGLGFYFYDVKGTILFGHGGGEQGTSTSMFYSLETGVGVVVFSNTSNANLDLILYALYKYGTEQ
ncbi:serine hydrolase domain-containing protein [Algoriphagus sp.]|uniref:serine hydrolase domain-containing protein n=1 Tax=Algoriphagus sp. TaxID=1872435 RepID=UPI00391A2D2B